MQVKVVNMLGEEMLLPVEMSLQGWPMEANLPGVEVEGKHGQVIDRSMVRLKPRNIRVAGMLGGLSKDDADRIREMIAGFVYRANPLRLYRHQLSERYMLVDTLSIDHSYITGKFGGRLFNMSIGFRAANPFLLGADQSVTITTASVNAENNGTALVNPEIAIAGAITNPVVTNTTTGQKVGLTMDIGAGTTVVVDCERLTARMNGVNVLSAVNFDFLLKGFNLVPGANIITVTGAGTPNIRITWTPRYW